MLPLKTLSLTQDNLILNLKHGPPILIMRNKQGFYLFNSLSSFASFDPNPDPDCPNCAELDCLFSLL